MEQGPLEEVPHRFRYFPDETAPSPSSTTTCSASRGWRRELLIEFMSTDTAKNMLRRSGYVPCVDGSINLRDTLCR